MEPEQQADSLATSIVNAAADSTAIEAVADIGEVALDAVLDESLLRDVPVLGTMYKVVHAAGTIRDRLFARKLLLFLEATSDIPDHEREEFAQTMEDDPSFRRKVGEHLILVLEQQDHFDKATILGKLFRGYMRRTIQYEMFRKLSHAVIFTSIDDLSRLPDLYAKLPTRYEISPHDPLIANGFFYAVPTVYNVKYPSKKTREPALHYNFRPNDLGSIYLKLVGETRPDSDTPSETPSNRSEDP